MTRKDDYYNRAKQEGYRSRAAYKLQQLDDDAGLFSHGDTVVDLGAAPGGWLQVAAERVGDAGTVVGVDLQRIDPLEADTVETVRGDMTEPETRASLLDVLGVDPDADDQAAANSDSADADSDSADADSDSADADSDSADADSGPASAVRPVDVVISDMAPNMTGQYELDHARSVYLARQAFEVGQTLLATGGDLVVKVFDGPDMEALRADMDEQFQYVRTVRPDASRDSSSELYLVAKGRTTAPVAVGDVLEVEITDEGREGDGIASVEGYTLFVSDVEIGDTVTVEVTDVKPRFGFAERTDVD